MDEMYIDNFLVQCNSRHYERHSDSSDFENSYNVPTRENSNLPLVASKDGNHSLISNVPCKKRKHDVVARRLCKNFQHYSVNTKYDRDKPQKEINFLPKRQVLCDKYVDCTNYNEIERRVSSSIRKKKRLSHRQDECSSRLSVRNMIVPCLSTELRHTTKCKTRRIGDNNNYYGVSCCAHCEQPRAKKFNKLRGDYPVQPVYAVAKEITGIPFQRINDYVELSQVDAIGRNNSSDYNHDYSLSSGSEQEDIKPYKHKKLMKYIMHKLEKRIQRENANVETYNHQKQQYPSKIQIKSPRQVYATSSCQTKSAFTDSASHSTLPSNSSEFWDFLLHKIKYQIHKAEVSKTTTGTCCNKDNCYFKANSNTSTNKPKPQTNSNTSTNKPKPQTPGSKQSLQKEDPFELFQKKLGQTSSQAEVVPKKRSENSEVICKCPKLDKSSSPVNIKSHDENRPCQIEHDILKKTIAEKYNAEVLCIHYPPCVLINGCLSLPQPKTATPQEGFYSPVNQSKRSSFVQMCRKMTRSKQRSQDQANQYHPPPLINLQEYLPEFRTEKIVQSACNHNPPCEVVRGCHKPRYNPNLQNSCIHVPMCPKFPECILEQGNTEEPCNHTPKCAELPLCTRKYIMLTAKENATTQVKPKTKIGCRHQPPCYMVPKCLLQAICGDLYPGNVIPGCLHQPSCEMIPACNRKQVKETSSVQSQYPSAPCRIV